MLSLLDGKEAVTATVALVFQSTCAITATRHWDSTFQGSFMRLPGMWALGQDLRLTPDATVCVCVIYKSSNKLMFFFNTLF